MNQIQILKTKEINGYIFVYAPEHPNNKSGYMQEHVLIVENFIGRYLTEDEVIHHISGVRNDNSLANLFLFPNQKAHASWHSKLKQYGYITNPMKRFLENRWEGYNTNISQNTNCIRQETINETCPGLNGDLVMTSPLLSDSDKLNEQVLV